MMLSPSKCCDGVINRPRPCGPFATVAADPITGSGAAEHGQAGEAFARLAAPSFGCIGLFSSGFCLLPRGCAGDLSRVPDRVDDGDVEGELVRQLLSHDAPAGRR